MFKVTLYQSFNQSGFMVSWQCYSYVHIHTNTFNIVFMFQARRLMDQYLQNKMAEEETMKGLVEKVTSTHENAKEAKKKLQEYKAKIGKYCCMLLALL